MSKFYYLLTSLPSLVLFERPDISMDRFIIICQDHLKDKDLIIIQKLDIIESHDLKDKDLFLKKWYDWEITLRNRIAKVRANKLNRDALPYLQEDRDFFPEIDKIVQDALETDNLIKREQIIDVGRWNRINELESGHIFDIDLIYAYKLKLQLCEKWHMISEEIGREIIESSTKKMSNISEQFLKY